MPPLLGGGTWQKLESIDIWLTEETFMCTAVSILWDDMSMILQLQLVEILRTFIWTTFSLSRLTEDTIERPNKSSLPWSGRNIPPHHQDCGAPPENTYKTEFFTVSLLNSLWPASHMRRLECFSPSCYCWIAGFLPVVMTSIGQFESFHTTAKSRRCWHNWNPPFDIYGALQEDYYGLVRHHLETQMFFFALTSNKVLCSPSLPPSEPCQTVSTQSYRTALPTLLLLPDQLLLPLCRTDQQFLLPQLPTKW